MRVDSSSSTSVCSTSSARRETVFSSRQSTFTPSRPSRSSIASTSRMRGTLRSTTSSLVSSEAASAGSAAFLLPAGVSVPESG